jgi:uncharacterized protein (DUF1501 family)
MTPQSRRDFLRQSLCASTFLGCGAVPGFFERTAAAASARPGEGGTVLVVIQLSGGNDGLNTVVPYEDDAYHRARPTLRLQAERVHKLETGLGLHPDMSAFARLYHGGRLGIVQGVGYPESKRDHDLAMRDWHSALPREALAQTGWAGRAADLAHAGSGVDIPCVFVGSIAPPFSVRAERTVVSSIASFDHWLPLPQWPVAAGPERRARATQAAPSVGLKDPVLEFLRESASAAGIARERIEKSIRAQAPSYPAYVLAQSLRSVAQLIRADLGIRFYFTELGGGNIGGFDSHAGQALNHGALLRELSESVAAFVDDLARDKLAESVLVMTFSEFGRALSENGRRGTDHGAAAPVFLAGGRVKPGLIGAYPSLADLDNDAPKFHTDFRRLYATVLDRWLGLDSQEVLGEAFAPLEVVRA